MAESYFEYTLSQCNECVIPSVCNLYKTKEKLLEDARKGFNGKDYILGQGLLIGAAEDFVSNDGYIVSSELNGDAMKLHTRFLKQLIAMKEENWRHVDIDREKMFNALVDLNWLLTSKYMHIQRKQNGKISLLSSPSIIRLGIKNGLTEVLHNRALFDKDRSEQYETAQLTRYQLLPGMHPDSQVKDLFAQGYTYSDFIELQKQAREYSIRRMALFYALTATAAKAEQIRRMR